MTNRYLKSVYTYDKSCEYTANSGMEGFLCWGYGLQFYQAH